MTTTIVINGDDYRQYHPHFKELQKEHGRDASKFTGAFSGKITTLAIEKAITEKRNIIIEGTFRTAETPLKTLRGLKENGYETHVAIKTCPKEASWEGTLERYNKALSSGMEARATPKEHHDLVVEHLPTNADIVYQSGLAKTFNVYDREEKIFDSETSKDLPSKAITEKLNQNKHKEETKSLADPELQEKFEEIQKRVHESNLSEEQKKYVLDRVTSNIEKNLEKKDDRIIKSVKIEQKKEPTKS